VVFKSTRRSEASLASLLPVLVAARWAGFFVPEPVRSRAGRLVEQGWNCETFVAGTPYTAARMPSISDRLKRFHALTEGITQRPGFAASIDLLRFDRGGDVDLDAMPASVAAACSRPGPHLTRNPWWRFMVISFRRT
jgi:hypothetical protein